MRRGVGAALVLAGLALALNELRADYAYGSPGTQDFIEYWAAGQLLRSGENPYDFDALLALERANGLRSDYPILTWNPAWLLAWLYPLLLLPFLVAAQAFLLLNLGVAITAIRATWSVHRPPSALPLVTLGFFPLVYALAMGQMSILLLGALAGFLACAVRGRDVLAGVFLGVTTLKPHLLPLVWLAVLAWVLRERRWRVLAGAALPVLGGALVATALRPTWVADYRALAAAHPPLIWHPDTLGGVLRLATGSVTLQFVPVAVGSVALVALARRVRFDPREHLGLLVALSLVVAPYGWSFDQTVLVVPVIDVLRRFPDLPRGRRAACAALLLLATAGLALQKALGVHPPFGFWTPLPVLAALGVARARW